jgi:hypothetical protein
MAVSEEGSTSKLRTHNHLYTQLTYRKMSNIFAVNTHESFKVLSSLHEPDTLTIYYCILSTEYIYGFRMIIRIVFLLLPFLLEHMASVKYFRFTSIS